MRLPWSIQKKILSYYLHRITFTRASDNKIIWTSFFYFSCNNKTEVSESADYYTVQFLYHGKSLTVQLRKGESSDIFVFFQVFIADGYFPLFDRLLKSDHKPKYCIDAGANIGYFSLAISCLFNNLQIIAIEPDRNNYELLKMNLERNKLNAQFFPVRAALWTRKQKIFLQNNEMLEWSYQVSESPTQHGECDAFTLQDFVHMQGWPAVQILKIDVEGAESALFQDQNFLYSLQQTDVIAIEIHDDQADRKQIHNIFNTMGFQFFEQGELTVACNTRRDNVT